MKRLLAAAAALVCAAAVTASTSAQASPTVAHRPRWACADGSVARRYTPGDDTGGEVPVTFCFAPGFRPTSNARGDSYRCSTSPRDALGRRAPDVGFTVYCMYVPGV